jgi:hypothetical protein
MVFRSTRAGCSSSWSAARSRCASSRRASRARRGVRAWTANGEVLWGLKVVALGDGDAEIVKVSVPGDPGVSQGEMVRVEGLTAQPWENEGRSGVAFRASAIRSASARTEKAAA